jgi:outer membrane receptor protein involved in Fe transport
VLGFEHTFPAGLSLRVEAYTKEMRDLRPRYENLLDTLALLPELKPDRIRIAPDGARARGVELLLAQQLGYPLTWWLAYSRSEVEDEIGSDTPLRSWDQTHALSAGLNWDTERWNVGIGVLHRSGWPTTPVTLDDTGEIPVAVPGPRSSQRMDYFRSVDLRVTRKVELESSSLAIFLEINNLLGRENPCCTEYEILDEEEGGGLELKTLSYLPRIPSLGFVWTF